MEREMYAVEMNILSFITARNVIAGYIDKSYFPLSFFIRVNLIHYKSRDSFNLFDSNIYIFDDDEFDVNYEFHSTVQ